MAKLDPHAALVKQLYSESGNAKVTHERLRQKGVEVSYESLRQWLVNHCDELPMLRTGRGKPKNLAPVQLFGFLDQITKWMPDAGMHPQFFMIFHQKTNDGLKDIYLVTFLQKFGIATSIQDLETTELLLKRLRGLCDLEVYLLAYLLGRHGPLIGATEKEFVALTRVVTPMAKKLKDVILRRNIVSVGELRELLCQTRAGGNT